MCPNNLPSLKSVRTSPISTSPPPTHNVDAGGIGVASVSVLGRQRVVPGVGPLHVEHPQLDEVVLGSDLDPVCGFQRARLWEETVQDFSAVRTLFRLRVRQMGKLLNK